MPLATASGIRGQPPHDLSPEYLTDIVTRINHHLPNGRLAIGSDPRATSPPLRRLVLTVLLAAGRTVLDYGVTTTPALYHAVRAHQLAGGLMITASHNPPDWNGLKPILPGGRGPNPDELDKLLQPAPRPPPPWAGTVLPAPPSPYLERIFDFAGRHALAPLMVAVDAGGSAIAEPLALLCRKLGVRLHTIHASPGLIARDPDPTADSLHDLRQLVRQSEARLGLAFDLDGDRLAVIDEQGRPCGADIPLLLITQALLKGRGIRDVVVTVDTTQAIADLVHAAAGTITYTPVGEARVVAEMMRRHALLGGEGSSGGVILAAVNWCRDGLLAAVLLMQLAAMHEGVASLVERLPQYAQVRTKLPCTRAAVGHVVNRLLQQEGQADVTDGIKLRPQPHQWILIRPSNTEPVLRLSAEAPTMAEAQSLLARYRQVIQELLAAKA